MKSRRGFARRSRSRPVRSDDIKVYHATTADIDFPDAGHSRQPNDFGDGFYVAVNRDFAENIMAGRQITDYHVYEAMFDDKGARRMYGPDYRVLKKNREWSRFTALNRIRAPGDPQIASYRIVQGPSADDGFKQPVKEYWNRRIPDDGTDYPSEETLNQLDEELIHRLSNTSGSPYEPFTDVQTVQIVFRDDDAIRRFLYGFQES